VLKKNQTVVFRKTSLLSIRNNIVAISITCKLKKYEYLPCKNDQNFFRTIICDVITINHDALWFFTILYRYRV
jgi:hypothetical protein